MSQILITNEKDALNLYGGNKEAFKSRDSYVILVGPAATGKALENNTLIFTSTGWMKICDLKIGDVVFNEKGENSKVTGVFPQGKVQLYNIKFSDGTSIEACGNHLWLTWTKDQRDIFNNPIRQRRNGRFRTGNPKILSTNEIKNNINKKFFIPMIAPVLHSEKGFLIDPYVMGAIIGDGHIGDKFISISSKDDFIINKVKSKLKDEYFLSKINNSKYDYRFTNNRIERNIYRKYWEGEKIRSNNKYIPSEYFYGSIKQRISLLQGLIDTDGYVSKKGLIEYNTCSNQLSLDVKSLVQSLGGTATIRSKYPTYTYKGEKKIGQLSYTLGIKLPKEIYLKCCSLPRKVERLRITNNIPYRKIISIEESRVSEATCISVDNPTSLYIAENYIVTHNTYALCWKMHMFALTYPGVKILLTRKSLRALRDSAVKTYQEVLRKSGYDRVVRTLGETRPTNFIYPEAENKIDGRIYKGVSEISLAPLDKNGKALGAEYDMVYVNQPDTEGCTLEEFKLIRSRCRLQNAPYRQLLADPNPSYDKHWLLMNAEGENNPNGFWKLYNSTHKDNPALYDMEKDEWTELGIEQMKELSELPGYLKDSLYEGKWFSASGMAFAGYWQPHKHILYLESEEAQELGVSIDNGNGTFTNIVPQDWAHYLAIDWGHDDPFVCLLIARHPTKDLFIVHKHIYITKTDIFKVAELVETMTAGYNIKAIIADRGRAEKTVMENTLGRIITGAIKNNTSNIDSMNICIAELNSDRWKFVSTADSLYNIPDPELIKKKKPMGYEEIPNLKKDDKTGKIADHQDDHFYDAWKYFCRYWVSENSMKNNRDKFIWL